MKTILFIIGLFVLSFLLLMPQKLYVGNLSLTRPSINLTSGGLKVIRDLNFKLGLDLQGGSHLVYEADTTSIPKENQLSAVLATKENIERRINMLGVSEPIIQTAQAGDKYRLIIELPGVKDVNTALQTIGATARLEFRELVPAPATGSAKDKPATSGAELVFKSTDLTGQDLAQAQVQFGGSTQTGKPAVAIQFTQAGSDKFAAITKRNIGKPLAIFLDNTPVTAPTVQDEILGGKAVISGEFTLDEAKRLSIQLNAGALPVPIHIVEQRNVGASLGNESVTKSLLAGIIGLVLVWIFMIANYGLKGLLANVALTLYVALSLSLFKLVPVTLTLAGIAGFILSVGMAVDANILIFERIKEELRWGRPQKAAIELGFHRAWTSVRDSNISSLITAGILFWFGSGSVRGFALTLALGILVSLFTSITITRSLVRLIYGR